MKLASARSMWGRFRREHGFDESRRCRECANCIRVATGSHYVHKYEKLGVTGSEASDIRLKDPACDMFMFKEVKNA